MPPNPPLLSIILPVFNSEQYVTEAIRSLQAQAVTDWELICVDDGSTDQSVERVLALNEPRLRLIRQTNQGPAAARNRGLEQAQGDFIAFIDADDLWPADKLARQFAVFTETPAVEVVVGLVQYHFAEGVQVPAYRFTHEDNRVFYYQMGAGLYRKAIFERVGGFNEAFRQSEDVDWYMRLKEQGIALRTLEYTTLLYRIHDHNMTKESTLTTNGLMQVLRNSLSRRRQSGSGDRLRNFSDY